MLVDIRIRACLFDFLHILVKKGGEYEEKREKSLL